jgi:pseudaminic acid biosynthesis-associated methylase
MSSPYSTEQEKFWAGEFGDDYTARNDGPRLVAANLAFFARVLGEAGAVRSVLELGANHGLNLCALQALLPEASLTGLEINAQAAARLRTLERVEVVQASLLDWQPARQYDLVFTKGVLIHIAPDRLAPVYDLLVRASARYILLAEYYAPAPVEVPYRGHSGRLFKRDFAGELLERHPQLRVTRHGFAWRRDPFPQDDLNWFLIEKPC